MTNRRLSQKMTWFVLIALFGIFLVLPILYMFWQSFGGIFKPFNVESYKTVFSDNMLLQSFLNSMGISFVTALITTILAFVCAYTVQFTAKLSVVKWYIHVLIILPMFIPTITYGFVIIYVFGKQGILTKILGHELFNVYGPSGLLIGYVIYTLPASYLIIYNALNYLDQRYDLISRMMLDSPMRRFYHTLFLPIKGTLASVFLISFILSFTDYGIPASISGRFEVIALTLYERMLGTIPNIAEGSVVALIMLIPSAIGIVLLSYVNRSNHGYTMSHFKYEQHRPIHDWIFRVISIAIVTTILFIFTVIFVVPFTKSYPYDFSFTLHHVKSLMSDSELTNVIIHALWVALLSAVIGLIVSFLTSLIATHTQVKGRKWFDWFSVATNAIPGMVIGLSYLLMFNLTFLKGTFLIIVLSIVFHYFTTPYVMSKSAMEKMSEHWQTTSILMQDSWIKTIFRIIIPNMKTTLVEIFSYYFINAMVTISGVIFLVSTTTMLASTKINELQHFNKFNEIFILSIVILVINLIVKGLSECCILFFKKRGGHK